MANLLEQKRKAEEAAKAKTVREEQARERRRKQDIRTRKLELAISLRRAKLIGETIRDAKLEESERLVISNILSRAKLEDDDRALLADFVVVPAAPDEPLIDYRPSRRDIAENQDAAE